MVIALYFSQYKALLAALCSLISSLQALRAQRSGHSLLLVVYLAAAGALMFLTLRFLPGVVHT